MDLAQRFSRLSPEQRKLLERKLGNQDLDILKLPVIRANITGSAEGVQVFPLSFGQERLWFIHQLEPHNSAYNLVRATKLAGNLNIRALERSINEILRRHDILRTTFIFDGRKPVQRIGSGLFLTLEIIDIKDSSGEEQEQEVEQIIQAESSISFDLENGPLLRTKLLKLSACEHVFLLVIHHIISDGTSIQVFIRELVRLYEVFSQGKESTLPGLPIRYADYACWQRQWFGEESLEVAFRKKQEVYWLEQFRGEIPVLGLPTDYPRPAVQSFAGNTVAAHLDIHHAKALKNMALREKTTLYMVLLSLFNIFLSKLSGQEDIVVGTPVAGRRHPDIRDLIGMFVNTLALRNYPHHEKMFGMFLGEVKERALNAFENQEYRYEDIVNKVEFRRDTGRNPLFDVMFMFRNVDYVEVDIPGLSLKHYQYDSKTSKFDLTFTAWEESGEAGDTLGFNFEYCTKLFKESTIQRFIGYFKQVVYSVVNDFDSRISEIEIIPEEEKCCILYDFNETQSEYPKEKVIHQLFKEQVEKNPDHIALKGAHELNEISITYSELDRKSDRLAHLLRGKGVLADSIVAIMMDRSIDMIIGILGILKAGGAYLPIDPDYPQDRIDYMLKDSGAILLVTSAFSASSAVKNLLPATGNRPVATSLAYIIYTSGTTGKPKGVGVEHRQAVNTLLYRKEAYGMNTGHVSLQLFSFSFDGFVTSFFTPVICGAKVVLPGKEEIEDVTQIKDTIARHGVTHFISIPGFYRVLLDSLVSEHLESLKVVTLAGDKLTPHLLELSRQKNRNIEIAHEYGVTEAAVMSTLFRHQERNEKVTIGAPIGNVGIYILDRNGDIQPVGLPGEMCIAGAGVSRGYLNRPELTAEKFRRVVISHLPFVISSSESVTNDQCPMTNDRLYRTGDLAWWLPDGNIEFLGRIDQQVKLRGFRVELGEIENELMNHPAIKEAVVIIREDTAGDKQLCAYVVCEGVLAGADLKEFLAKKLPTYMIPSFFVILDRMPLTPNGKVDRNALPAPEITAKKLYTAPRDELEEKLIEIWSEVLGIEKDIISVESNFFELGGHSLKAMVMVSKIHKVLDVKLPVAEVFKRRTIGELAGYFEQAEKGQYTGIEPMEEKEYYELSSAQKRLYFLQQMDGESITYNMPLVLPFGKNIEINRLESTLKELIARHESLRTSFELVNEEAVQRVHKEVEFKIEYYDLATEAGAFIRPFDLSRVPLIRSGIIKNPDGSHIWIVDMHHIVSDGTSQVVLKRDFMSLYHGEELKPLRLHYKDFSHWQNRLFERGAIKAQEDYWLSLYSDIAEIPRLNLPGDYQRPQVFTFVGAHYSFVLERDDALNFKALGIQNGGTLYMNVLAALNVLFYKYTGQTDIIIGGVTAGRPHADLQRIIGMFVNTVAMRNQPEGEKRYQFFLKEVIAHSVEVFENQDVQFEELVEKLGVERDLSRNPLFDVTMVVQTFDVGEVEVGEGAELPVVEGEDQYANKTAKFDMTFFVVERGENIYITIEYYTGVFKEETVRQLALHFKTAIKSVFNDPLVKLKDIEIMSEEEKRRVLCMLNETVVEYPKDKTIGRLFEVQSARVPDHSAVVCMGHAITYRELNEKSNRLAHYLLSKGVIRTCLVGLMADRHPEMIIGILAILKAGCGYVPLDPHAPVLRTRYILAECDVKMALTLSTLVDDPSGFPQIIFLDDDSNYSGMPHRRPGVEVEPGDLAYVIFTSGSTGKPKGVPISHANLSPLLHWGYEQLGISSGERTLQNLAYYFDWSVWEIFITLTSGAVLYMAADEVLLDPGACAAFIRKEGITVLHATPHQYNHLLGSGQRLESLKYLFIGAEKFSIELLHRSVQSVGCECRIFNMYGPTEATIISGVFEVDRSNENNYDEISSVPIGRSVGSSRFLVLDSERGLQLCPVNIVGELYIGGSGLSRGYLNKSELTAEKFRRVVISHLSFVISSSESVTNDQCPMTNDRLYRSGDLARWLPDGNIEFLGRIDHQVKLRGFRVELGEIQDQLLKIAGIRDAVVVDKKDASGDIYLCAYIVADEAVEPAEARQLLSRVLPDYMLPAYVIKINKIPLTPNGKVDRKALPEPEFKAGEGERAAPLDALQQKLAETWADILNIEKENVDINTSFFDMGGHSLKATILIARIHQAFEVKIPLPQVFTTPTIKELAEYIRRTRRERHISIEPAEEKEYYPLSSTQKRLYILQQLASDSPYYNIPAIIEPEESIAEEKLEAVFKKMIARHEILRTSFEMVAEEPVQRVHNEVEFKIEVKVEEEILSPETLIEHFIRPFDLSQAPLLRAKSIKAPGGRQILLMDMHHIITDATSQEILKKEFKAICSGEQLADLRLQYKDYSEWQNSREQEEVIKKQEVYWIKEFSDDLPVLNLPTDYPRPLMQRFEGNRVNFALTGEETGILKTLTQENDATLYMGLLAVFSVLFSKLSGQEDIILGAPIAARRHVDLQNVVGMFLNTLPMRNYPSADKPFKRFLGEVKKRTLEAYENQEYPFENLVGNLAVDRDTSRNPLFDVMLVLMNQAEYSGEISEMLVRPPYRHLKRTSRFDMSVVAVDMGKNLYVSIEYSTNLFTPATIEKYIAYFKNIIRHLGADTQQKISDIEYITREEKEAILELSSGLREIAPVELTVHEMFEEKAGQAADNTALVFAGQHLSYGELNRRSNRLARVLREKGIGPGAVVGVMVERSIEMIIALLAVLKAGGAYVPIDPGYPEQRILSMLEDSRASLLLTTGNLVRRFSVTALKGMRGVEQEEKLVVTPPQAQIKDFDAIPIPDRTLIDYEKYHRYIGEAPAKNTITMQATRGCPYNCLYCHKIWPKTHVARSAENVFKEISYAYEAGVRRFVFIDDIFNLDRKNAERFLETIVKSRLDIRLFFPNGFRADILSRDFIDLMMAAGTVNLDVALESASPRIQRLIKKNLDLERFKENVEYITRKYPQVILEMEMMHGFPTETEKEALMTLDFLKEFQWVHFPNLHVLKIFPNTDMCRFAIESGISEALIERSANLAFHELPDTLPFPKSFTRQFQARFMGEYFLLKERLLDVLPHQMRVLTEDELVQKYDSYLSFEVKHFSDILQYAGISREELGDVEPCREETYGVPDFCNRISKHFPVKKPAKDAFRILLLDLSQLFSEEHEHMLHHQIEEPLGLLYLMSYLNGKFKERISGKVFKSRIDFDSYDELKRIIMDFKPDLIGIRTLSFYREFFHRAVLMMRQWGVAVPIATGGPYATSDYRLILQDPHVNLVVLGEGELTLGEVVKAMMENGNNLPGEEVLKEIRGLAFLRDRDKDEYKGVGKQVRRDILLLDELRSARLEGYPGQNLESINKAGDLFYVIYTSGSTGKPKGVMLEHRNIANLIRYQYNHTNIDFDRVLQFTTISFDVSAQEIFSTLLAGGRLVLISKETLNDIPELFRVVARESIRTLFAAASFLKFVMNEEEYVGLVPGCLKHIVTAGEQLIVSERFRKYLRENKVYLHNHYGPSETHVVTALTLSPEGEIPELPSIGRPVSNTAIYILDRGMRLVPVGVAGELMIGGMQVGRGYIYQPGLTAEKFVISHLSFVISSSESVTNDQCPMTNDRLYRTGDLARWLADGNIEFLGRMDYQVKVRGFRVELGEIESQLLNHPWIKACVVVAREDDRGGRYLCAYIVPDQELEVSDLREYLGRDLPDYMIPSYFVFLDQIPLTPNRKVDRRALPSPELKAGDNYIAPENAVEKKLAEIWSEILGIARDVISVESNFFELGGHSLTATILAAKVNKEFHVKLPLVEIFQMPTIRGLSRYLGEAVEDRYSSIEPVEKKEYYVLSSAQKRLYILHQMDVNSTVYNMPEIIPLAEAPEVEELAEVFRKLIRRHEILRTSFGMVNGEPVQRIHEKVEFEIEQHTPALSGHPSQEGITRAFVRSFDLSEAPLLRVALSKTEEEKHLLLVDMHHIICDGISHRILVQDFNALSEGEGLESLRIQYKDFAEWQRSEQEVERLKQQEVYWLDRFRGEAPVLDLPLDFPRPAVQSFAGSRIHFEIGSEETHALKKVALEERATLFMVLLAVTDILLAKLSGQQDIIIGIPIAGRRSADMQKMIGMFVNTLALRNEPGDELPFSEFLRDLRMRTLAAFENQEYPFETLVEKVSLDRDVSRNPLFDVMMVLQNFAEFQEKNRVREIMGEEAIELTTAKFDLTLEAVEVGSRLVLSFNYCTALFKPQTIERFAVYFKNIITGVTGNTNIKIADIEIISTEEKDRVLYDFNHTEMEYPEGKTIYELFEDQVERTPDHIAVVETHELHELHEITYSELNRKSGQVAGVLKEKGVLADGIVAIMMEPSVEMIIVIFGILKAGGAYFPIDPDYPEERKQYMLTDSGAKLLVTTDNLEAPDCPLLPATGHRPPATYLAYVIYTSGTTGKPKGVGVEHRQAVNTLLYRKEAYGMNTGHVALQLFSFSFDGFVTSFFTPVIGGAKVVLPGKEEIKDVTQIKDTIARHGVTHFISIPGFYRVLLDSLVSEHLESLKVVTLAGDKLTPHLLELSRQKNRDIEIAHEYGVTEAAVMSTLFRHQERNEKVTIGAPIGNVGIYILDRNGHIQPVGLPGEMCIAGAGVSRGYLNRPELTAEKFERTVNGHSSLVIRSLPGSLKTNDQCLMTNDRLYRTGDLARWLSEGNIEFLGRIDQQVKIRGFRIELEEIENRLLAHPGIKRVVVIDWKSPGEEKYLCAYIVSQMPLSADSLEAFLAQSLPDYMIPSYFVQLQEIPLTPNGKIDRKSLPAPGLKQAEYIAPRNPIEKKLVEIWSVVLEVEKEKIGIDDNFFGLGGHSLKATIVMSRINRELGVKVPLVELFKTPTIRQLGEYIIGTKREISIIKDDQLVLLKKGFGRIEPFFFIHDGSGEVEGYIEFCNRLSGAYDFWGIQAQKIENYTPLNLSIEELAQRYIKKMRRVQAHGPYRIAGWSIGGTIGFEMVRQLEEQKEEVGFLGLIDTVPPDKDLSAKRIEFNLESELKLIRDYFPGEAITKKLKGIEDFSRVWPEMLVYLESSEFRLEDDNDRILKNIVPGDFAQTVPNLEQMSIKEFIIYLNMVRTYDNARNKYIPAGKIDTAVHFFKANEGEVIDAEKWSIYCNKPIKVYDIPGDHLSMFKMPGVMELAKLFDRVIDKVKFNIS